MKEVLISLKERELFEKSVPGDLVVLAVLHHMLGDFHCLLYFCQHDVTGGQRDVVSGVHAWERWSDDWEVVLLVFFVEETLVVYLEGNQVWVIFDLAKLYWIVMSPLS